MQLSTRCKGREAAALAAQRSHPWATPEVRHRSTYGTTTQLQSHIALPACNLITLALGSIATAVAFALPVAKFIRVAYKRLTAVALALPVARLLCLKYTLNCSCICAASCVTYKYKARARVTRRVPAEKTEKIAARARASVCILRTLLGEVIAGLTVLFAV